MKLSEYTFDQFKSDTQSALLDDRLSMQSDLGLAVRKLLRAIEFEKSKISGTSREIMRFALDAINNPTNNIRDVHNQVVTETENIINDHTPPSSDIPINKKLNSASSIEQLEQKRHSKKYRKIIDQKERELNNKMQEKTIIPFSLSHQPSEENHPYWEHGCRKKLTFDEFFFFYFTYFKGNPQSYSPKKSDELSTKCRFERKINARAHRSRKLHRTSKTLTKDQIRNMTDNNFKWGKKADEKIMDIDEFILLFLKYDKKPKNHSNPYDKLIPEEKIESQIYMRASYYRREYKKGSLHESVIDKLNTIGFVWEKKRIYDQKLNFDDFVEQYVSYQMRPRLFKNIPRDNLTPEQVQERRVSQKKYHLIHVEQGRKNGIKLSSEDRAILELDCMNFPDLNPPEKK